MKKFFYRLYLAAKDERKEYDSFGDEMKDLALSIGDDFFLIGLTLFMMGYGLKVLAGQYQYIATFTIGAFIACMVLIMVLRAVISVAIDGIFVTIGDLVFKEKKGEEQNEIPF